MKENESQDVVASWTAFFTTVHMGGSLPVTFRLDSDHVVVEMIVPYVASVLKSTDSSLAIAEGFPVPISARFRLPAYSPTHEPRNAAQFIRHLVREIYHHEIDEQLHINDNRPFAPEH